MQNLLLSLGGEFKDLDLSPGNDVKAFRLLSLLEDEFPLGLIKFQDIRGELIKLSLGQARKKRYGF